MKVSLLLVALIPATLVAAGPLQARDDENTTITSDSWDNGHDNGHDHGHDNGHNNGWNGNAKCDVKGYRINFGRVKDCCLRTNGGSWFHHDTLTCTLPIKKEGPFRKCVKNLGYATSVDCDY